MDDVSVSNILNFIEKLQIPNSRSFESTEHRDIIAAGEGSSENSEIKFLSNIYPKSPYGASKLITEKSTRGDVDSSPSSVTIIDREKIAKAMARIKGGHPFAVLSESDTLGTYRIRSRATPHFPGDNLPRKDCTSSNSCLESLESSNVGSRSQFVAHRCDDMTDYSPLTSPLIPFKEKRERYELGIPSLKSNKEMKPRLPQRFIEGYHASLGFEDMNVPNGRTHGFTPSDLMCSISSSSSITDTGNHLMKHIIDCTANEKEKGNSFCDSSQRLKEVELATSNGMCVGLQSETFPEDVKFSRPSVTGHDSKLSNGKVETEYQSPLVCIDDDVKKDDTADRIERCLPTSEACNDDQELKNLRLQEKTLQMENELLDLKRELCCYRIAIQQEDPYDSLLDIYEKEVSSNKEEILSLYKKLGDLELKLEEAVYQDNSCLPDVSSNDRGLNEEEAGCPKNGISVTEKRKEIGDTKSSIRERMRLREEIRQLRNRMVESEKSKRTHAVLKRGYEKLRIKLYNAETSIDNEKKMAEKLKEKIRTLEDGVAKRKNVEAVPEKCGTNGVSSREKSGRNSDTRAHRFPELFLEYRNTLKSLNAARVVVQHLFCLYSSEKSDPLPHLNRLKDCIDTACKSASGMNRRAENVIQVLNKISNREVGVEI